MLTEMVAEKIRALREEKGMNQAELAKATASTQTKISRIELGKSFSLEALEAIALALDLEGVEELIAMARL